MDHPDWLPLIEHYQTHPVPQRYNAGVVIASIAVSLLGSYTTLLLLGRRTSKAGLRDLLLLGTAAGTMAGVGIWGMHFVGMHMRLEAEPGVFWYIRFNPLWTVFSLFVPLLALVCAFIFLGSQAQFSYIRVVPAGLFFGGICATMHYTAACNANFKVTYAPLQTAFSVVLACSASTVALIIFFRWRTQWQDNWWKRLLCAFILAAGVSSMHYCGVGGTSYYVKGDRVADLTSGKHTTSILSGAISAMCGILCLVSIGFVVFDMKHSRKTKEKARQILVASAVFDKKGNLLVKADGTLPSQVVFTRDMPKDMMAELDSRQPIFQWLYSLSWDWTVLESFADRIAARAFGLQATKTPLAVKEERRTSQPVYLFGNTRVMRRAAGLASFKDRFLECTFLLAHELGLPYHSMGTLFDKTILTGTTLGQVPLSPDIDIEKGTNRLQTSLTGKTVKEGGLLVLVREVSGVGTDTIENFIDKGFRFSETRFLAPVLADKLGMDRTETAGLLKELKTYARRGGKPVVQAGGCYVGVFAVSPSLRFQGGLDALVYGFARHQCPAYRLPDIKSAGPAAKEWLAGMIGQSMETVRQTAFDEAISHNEVLQLNQPPEYTDEGEAISQQDTDFVRKAELAAFQTAFYVAIDAMMSAIRVIPDTANRSRLSSELLDMPSTLDDSGDPAQMIFFHTVVPPSDQFTPPSQVIPEYGSSFSSVPTFVFTPYTLFSRGQSALLRGKFSKDFAREVRLELYKRYPNSATSPSIMDEICNSPLVAKKVRHSVVTMSPLMDRTKSLTKLWDKKEKPGMDDDWREKEGFDDVQLVTLSSPVRLNGQRNKRHPANELDVASDERSGSPISETDIRPEPSTEDLRTPPNQSPRLAMRASIDNLSPGRASTSWVTPPPAFPASALARNSTGTSKPVLRRANTSDTASRALLVAMSETVGTPGSLPAYRSPGSSPPPLVPLPLLPAASLWTSLSPSVSPDAISKIRKSRRSYTRATEGMPSLMSKATASVVKPLAQAARLRSDCWYERAMGEIEHSENARELYGVIHSLA